MTKVEMDKVKGKDFFSMLKQKNKKIPNEGITYNKRYQQEIVVFIKKNREENS